MYHGGVVPGRGVERVMGAVGMVPGASYVGSPRALAESVASGCVPFHPAAPREGLEAWVAAADVGMVVLQAVSRNNYFTPPNKLFENVQAETPVIVSDFPETSRVVGGCGIGLACDSSSTEAVAACIARMRDDADLRAECKAGLSAAKRELCWERERAVLEEAYEGLAASYG